MSRGSMRFGIIEGDAEFIQEMKENLKRSGCTALYLTLQFDNTNQSPPCQLTETDPSSPYQLQEANQSLPCQLKEADQFIEYGDSNTSSQQKAYSVFMHVVREFLISCNISEKSKGFHYLNHCAQVIQKFETFDFAVTKDVYPEVAKRYHTSIHDVEYAIRTAIRHGWNQKKSDQQDKKNGMSYYFHKKPTNGEFICHLYNLKQDLALQEIECQ